MDQLQREAQAGSAPAQMALAERFLNGETVLQNHAKAAEWFHRAAEAGHHDAQNKLGQLYHTGLGVTRDVAAALHWLERAAQSGEPGHLFDYAAVLESPEGGADFARAAVLYGRASDAGSLEATVSLGVLYQNGTGVMQNADRARALYERAARASHPRALNNLGLLYVRGEGVEQDYTRAANLFSQAADLGLRVAMTNLGVMYANAFGVPLDEAKAAALYRMGGASDTQPGKVEFLYDPRVRPVNMSAAGLARLEERAQARDPVAQFQLGWVLMTQTDPPFAAIQRAATLFERAAAQAYGPAMANLSLMYFKGQGVPQDYMLGQMWLLLANRSGVDTDPISVAFGSKLTADQINLAQDRALAHMNSYNP